MGSSLHTRATTTNTENGKESQPLVEETRSTLGVRGDGEFVLRQQFRTGGLPWSDPVDAKRLDLVIDASMGAAEPPADEATAEPKEIGRETLTIDGTKYECKKLETSRGGEALVRWVDAKGVDLKSEIRTAGETRAEEIVSFARKVKAGDREVVCRVHRRTEKRSSGDLVEDTYRSEEVPGGLARTEKSSTIRSKDRALTTRIVEEVVGFEVK